MTNTQWLALSAVVTAVMWMPHVLNRMAVLGVGRTLGNPMPGDEERLAPWAQRSARAYLNAVVNLAVFAPLVLSAPTAEPMGLAVKVYFFARVIHFVTYAAGVPVLRTLAFAGGFAAQLLAASGVFL